MALTEQASVNIYVCLRGKKINLLACVSLYQSENSSHKGVIEQPETGGIVYQRLPPQPVNFLHTSHLNILRRLSGMRIFCGEYYITVVKGGVSTTYDTWWINQISSLFWPILSIFTKAFVEHRAMFHNKCFMHWTFRGIGYYLQNRMD